jgi:hypothetical protein
MLYIINTNTDSFPFTPGKPPLLEELIPNKD